jgi:hypothetical protein
MRTFVIASMLAAAVIVAGTSGATDIQVPGKKLLIKNPPSGTANNKLVFLAKGANIVAPSGVLRDPTVLGGYLHVSGDGGDFTINLPAGGWTANTAVSLYKYKDTTGATCKIVIIKNATLEKAVCKGTQVAYDLGAPQGPVNVIVGTGTEPLRHCHQFDAAAPESCDIKRDGSDDKTYLAKNCAGATVGCPSPSGAFLDVSPAVF